MRTGFMISGKKIITVLVILLIAAAYSCGEKKGTAVGKSESAAVNSLRKMAAPYPSSIQKHILSDPRGFLHSAGEILRISPEMFVMADKKHALGKDFIPKDLVLLTEYPELVLSRKTLKLRAAAVPDLLRMCRAARKDGVTLVVSSTYRSFQYQKMLFDREVKLYGLKTAERESARPGTSQHQLGVAIDFGSISDSYAATPAGKWLAKHAWEYGFSLSYPAGYEWLTGYRPEVWHYRYITPAGTRFQRMFFDNVQQYMLMFIHDNRNGLEALLSNR